MLSVIESHFQFNSINSSICGIDEILDELHYIIRYINNGKCKNRFHLKIRLTRNFFLFRLLHSRSDVTL